MLHEIGRGEPDTLLAGASHPLRRSRQSLWYCQGARVLERNCADYGLRTQRCRPAPTDSLAIDHIRHQTYGAAIRTGGRELESGTLGGMRRARGGRSLAIGRGTILTRRSEVRGSARRTLGFFLPRSMRQGELSGAADMFVADLGGALPRRQGARRFDDGKIAANPIQLVFGRERGDSG